MTVANCAPPPPIQTLNVVKVGDSFAALQWNASSGRRINVDDRIGGDGAASPSTSTGATRRPAVHAALWRKSGVGRGGGEIGVAAAKRPYSYSLSWNAQEDFVAPSMPYVSSSSSNIILPSSQTEVMLGGLAPNTHYLLGLFAFNECARTQPLSIRFATRRTAVESDDFPFVASFVSPSSTRSNHRLSPRQPNAVVQVPPPPFSPAPAVLPHELILVMIVMILWIFILRRFFQTYKKITCVNVLPTAFGSSYELTKSGGGNGGTDDDHSRRRSNTSSQALWDRKVSNVSAVEESRSSNAHNQFELLEGAVCAWRSETVLSTRLPRETYPSSSAAFSDRDGSRPENVPRTKRSSISISGVPVTLERFLLEQRRRHRRHRRRRSGGDDSRSATASRVGVDECCSSSMMMATTTAHEDDDDEGEEEEDPVLVRFNSCSPTKMARLSAGGRSSGVVGGGEVGLMMLSSSPRASITTLPCYPIPRVTIELDSNESSVARKISLNFTPTPSPSNPQDEDQHLQYPYYSFIQSSGFTNIDSLLSRQLQQKSPSMHYSHSMPTFHRNLLESGSISTTSGTTATAKRKNALATVVMAATAAAAAADEQNKRRGGAEDVEKAGEVYQQTATTAAPSESTTKRSTTVRRTVPNPRWRMATASAVASTVTSGTSTSGSESTSATAARASFRRRSYYVIDAIDGSPVRRKISDVLLGKATKDIRRCSTFTGNNSVTTSTAGQLLRLQQHSVTVAVAASSPSLQRKRQLSTHSSLRRRLSNFGSSLPRRFSLRRKSRRSAFVHMSSLQEERECSPLAVAPTTTSAEQTCGAECM